MSNRRGCVRASEGETMRAGPITFESLEPRALLAIPKIMPLGDSITEGWSSHGSYRPWLWNSLATAGYTVDLVGSMTGIANGLPPPNPNYDQNHEGHSGWTADQVQSNIASWANAAKPDIVMLHIGTNDINSGQPNSGTETEIRGIIDNLRSVVPNVKILLAKIIPLASNISGTVDLNNRIANIVSSKTTGQSPITLVDQYTGFSTSNLWDGIHPNDTGDQQIASKWYSALQGILGSPAAPPPGKYLGELPFSQTPTNGWGPVEVNRSNNEQAGNDGHVITLNGVSYMRGIGGHASSDVRYNIQGLGYSEFDADIGVDDEIASFGSINFQVYVDNTLKYDSGTMSPTSATKSIAVPIASNAKTLRLVITDGGNGNGADHGDWANARLVSAAQVTPPSAPSALNAVVSGQQVNLTWTDNAGNETGFRVERKTGGGGTYGQIADIQTANTQSYSDTTAVPGTTYFYRVYAYNSAGASGFSNESSGVTVPVPPSPPSAPTGLSATVVNQQINLAWTDTAGNEDGFKIERKAGSGGTYAPLVTLATPSTQSYSDTTATPGVTYFYRVYAYNSGGPSGFSNDSNGASVPLPSGTVYLSDQNFMVNANGWGPLERDKSNGEQAGGDGATITLNGTTYAKGLGVHAYSEVLFNLGGQYTQFLADVGLDDEVAGNGLVVFQVYLDNVKVFDSGAMNGSSATQHVNISTQGKNTLKLVVNDAGNGNAYDHADWADAKLVAGTPVAPPSPATLLTANLNGSQVDVTWGDVSSETGYRLQRKLGANGAWTDVKSVGANVIATSDTTPLLPSSTYFYRVIAFNNGGDATPSNELSVTTPAGAPQTWVSDLNWVSQQNGWGPVEKDMSNGEQGGGDGSTITLRGTTYAKGLGVHGYSKVVYNLGGAYTTFTSDVGVDDETGGNGSVIFEVYVDGLLKYSSGVVRGTDAVQTALVNVAGAQQIWLVVQDWTDGTGWDHADWAGARLS